MEGQPKASNDGAAQVSGSEDEVPLAGKINIPSGEYLTPQQISANTK